MRSQRNKPTEGLAFPPAPSSPAPTDATTFQLLGRLDIAIAAPFKQSGRAYFQTMATSWTLSHADVAELIALVQQVLAEPHREAIILKADDTILRGPRPKPARLLSKPDHVATLRISRARNGDNERHRTTVTWVRHDL